MNANYVIVNKREDGSNTVQLTDDRGVILPYMAVIQPEAHGEWKGVICHIGTMGVKRRIRKVMPNAKAAIKISTEEIKEVTQEQMT